MLLHVWAHQLQAVCFVLKTIVNHFSKAQKMIYFFQVAMSVALC